MNSMVIIVLTALISGLLATIVTIWWQRRSELRRKKMGIFETLMAYRYMISHQESVNALNSIDVVFYKEKSVRKAYASFLNETGKKLEFNPNIADKHLKLLEEMSKSLGLKEIHWDDIKQCYYPAGLAQRIQDEEMLRKVQIQNALDAAKQNAEQQNTPASNQFNEQFALKLLPDLIKNPDILKMLLELSREQ